MPWYIFFLGSCLLFFLKLIDNRNIYPYSYIIKIIQFHKHTIFEQPDFSSLSSPYIPQLLSFKKKFNYTLKLFFNTSWISWLSLSQIPLSSYWPAHTNNLSVLRTERLCPLQFICWNFNACCGGIRRWGLYKVLRSWGCCNNPSRIGLVFLRKRPQRACLPLLPHEKVGSLQPRRWT